MDEKPKGVSLRNAIRHIKKNGIPDVKIKHPQKYLNRWRSMHSPHGVIGSHASFKHS